MRDASIGYCLFRTLNDNSLAASSSCSPLHTITEICEMTTSATHVVSASDVIRFRISHRTSGSPNADTDSEVWLHVISKSGALLDSFKLDNPDIDDRRGGCTDSYGPLPANTYPLESIDRLRLQIYGDDAWLPVSVVVEAMTRNGLSYVLFANTSWRSWLSTDTSDCNGYARPYYDLVLKPRGSSRLVEVSTDDELVACDPTTELTT
jgi:hypothetical protein